MSTHQIYILPFVLNKNEDEKPIPNPIHERSSNTTQAIPTAIYPYSGRSRSPLLSSIDWILQQPPRTIHAPPFSFGTTSEDISKNLNILREYDMSLTKLLAAQPFSPCSFGSEFRDVTSLEKIYHCHPKWDRLKDIVQNGADYPMIELDHTTRQQDLQQGLTRGNHPGAKVFEKEMEKIFKKNWIMVGCSLYQQKLPTCFPSPNTAPPRSSNR